VSQPDAVDTAATFTAYRAAAQGAGPAAVVMAEALWPRLEPRRWTLEWQLPVWLGEAFGLEPDLQRRLVTSNVLGLASIRLADDLADGDVADGDAGTARGLAAALYEAALAPYRGLFPGNHRFWARLDGWMAEWRLETGAAAPFGPGREALPGLAGRGAPLKIPAFAVCLMTGREDAFQAIERCLDHALRAMVLYDHACDWRADLARGRWNALAGGEGDARRVEARLLGEGTMRPYFARIDLELEQAAQFASGLGIARLAAHLSSLRASLAAEGEALASRYDLLGNATMELLFGQYAT
jgi:hypothetical protein